MLTAWHQAANPSPQPRRARGAARWQDAAGLGARHVALRVPPQSHGPHPWPSLPNPPPPPRPNPPSPPPQPPPPPGSPPKGPPQAPPGPP